MLVNRPLRWAIRSIPLFVIPIISIVLQWPLLTTLLSLLISCILLLLYLQRGLISLRTPWTWRILIIWLIQIIIVKGIEYLVYDKRAFIPIYNEQANIELDNKFLAPPKKYNNSNTLSYSIVLPCANEGEFMVKTAKSVYESTPSLHEIIVVDDGSTPPLRTLVTDDQVKLWKLKFIRHEHFTGLINAKSVGGWKATGDIITFLDCHVKPDIHWTEPTSKYILENPKTVVVPTVTSLDPNTWLETRDEPGTTRCCKLTWNVDFPWYNAEDTRIPIMIGGLLSMHRNMWEYTGGYDSGMIGWGGENVDQSLRIHLCGGEIMHALDSYIAHMWRLPGDEKTKAKYTLPSGSLMRNRYRAALSWFDEFIAKAEEQSEFMYWGHGGDRPDVSNVLDIKKKNHCKHFSYFLKKFKFLYEDAGLLPDNVYHIKAHYDNGVMVSDDSRCLELRDKHRLVMNKCSSNNRLQLWHGSNYDSPHSFKCCQGIRFWNSGICLGIGGNRLSPTQCMDDGTSPLQTLHITDDGQLLTGISLTGDNNLRGVGGGVGGGGDVKCVVPPEILSNNDEEIEKASLNGCQVDPETSVTKPSQKFTMLVKRAIDGSSSSSSTFLLQTDADKLGGGDSVKGGKACLRASDEPNGPLTVAECDYNDNKQVWEWIHKIQIRNINTQQCIDAADGNTPITYVCYGEEEYNIGQQFIYDKPSGTIMNTKTYKCLDVHNENLIELPPLIKSGNSCNINNVWTKYMPFVPLETKLYASSPAVTQMDM